MDQFRTDHYSGVAAQTVPWRVQRVKIYVLNLFCGFRRQDDIKQALRAAPAVAVITTGVHLMVLSIDVAIDAERCDLMRVDSLQVFANGIKSRQVVLTGGGPPCET